MDHEAWKSAKEMRKLVKRPLTTEEDDAVEELERIKRTKVETTTGERRLEPKKGGRKRKTKRKLWFRKKTAKKNASRKSGSFLGSTAGHSALSSMGIPMGF